MAKNILIIGGTRFFGKLIVKQQVEAGNHVTIATRGQAKDDFGNQVNRVIIDRRDEKAMFSAFSKSDDFDIIYDQVCYNPLDAAIAIKVFKNKVKRYVMSSTIEVYDCLQGKIKRPFFENDLDLLSLPIDINPLWYNFDFAEKNYGLGKRQAEALFYQSGVLPIVSVRIGHVLAGSEDFTGRLAHYVKKVERNEPIQYSETVGKSSFIHVNSIRDFMRWVGENSFLGPINAADKGDLSALEIYQRIAKNLNTSVKPQPIANNVKPSELSPFDYAFPYSMNTQKSQSLGYYFTHSDEWIDELIQQHIQK